MAWHHIVEQNPSNIAKFGAERIHNVNNIIKIPNGKGSIHAKISGYYNSKQNFTNYHYDKIREIIGFLKREKALPDLSIFLKHPNPYVTSGAAVNILPWDEKKSLGVLKSIKNNERGIVSIEAEYSIKEWENGILKNYYTLQ